MNSTKQAIYFLYLVLNMTTTMTRIGKETNEKERESEEKKSGLHTCGMKDFE